jgi:two-component system chemotaxis response regulator CheB
VHERSDYLAKQRTRLGARTASQQALTMTSTQPPFPGAAFDVVVLAASAGGLRALSEVVGGLPGEFPAGLLVVQHLDPNHRSMMAEILSRRTALRVRQAQTGDRVEPGLIFTAPPDRHLLVNPDMTLMLAETELVHFVRPSADLLFESAAACCNRRVVGVILTGTGSDGNMGVTAIKKMGGTVIVEDPATAEFAGMPQAAVATGCFDHRVPLHQIAPTLCRLVIVPPNQADPND